MLHHLSSADFSCITCLVGIFFDVGWLAGWFFGGFFFACLFVF